MNFSKNSNQTLLSMLIVLLFSACGGGGGTDEDDPIIDPPVDIAALKIELGEAIFNDSNLSEPAGQSCADCHEDRKSVV